MALTPTPEQQAALDVFASGLSMALDALAGTGKTSTLKMLAESAPHRRGQYLAFNKAIVVEAERKFPRNVSCKTAHGLAFATQGRRFGRRLKSRRILGSEMARILGVDPFTVAYGSQRKVLQPGYLASHVVKAIDRFCQSADPVPTRDHIGYIDGIDLPEPNGARTHENNDRVKDALEPHLAAAWADLSDPDGRLRFNHDCQPPGTLVRVYDDREHGVRDADYRLEASDA